MRSRARSKRLATPLTPRAAPSKRDTIMKVDLPASWKAVVGDELKKPYFQELAAYVDGEREKQTIYPPETEVFNAYKRPPFDDIRVVLLGQDPYPGPSQAHGLCFSVWPGVPLPRSLGNIFKELHDDLGCKIPNNGSLVSWADQGILLLNAVLTVRARQPNSHKNRGWEQFTDAAIRAVNAKSVGVVFMLWGAYAQKKGKHI